MRVERDGAASTLTTSLLMVTNDFHDEIRDNRRILKPPPVERAGMSCDNCRSEERIAYTLQTHVAGDDRTVELEFCSADCLRGWT